MIKNLLKKDRDKINNVICNAATGIFHDCFWHGKDIVLGKLHHVCEENNLTWDIYDAKYEHENGIPIRKIWTFKVADKNGRASYGRIIAAGAGTVNDPLLRYDIVAYL